MKQLSHRRVRFAELYVKNNYNQREAYMEAYECTNKDTASVGAHNLLKDERVLAEIKRQEGSFRMVGQKFGLNKDTMVKSLIEMMSATKITKVGEVPDWTARHNAIMAFAKLTGDLVQEKEAKKDKPEEDTIDLSKLKTKKEIMTARKQLLQALASDE